MKIFRNDRYGRANNIRPAFTLIELLVVISIIALLLAILMPALSGVRNIAKRMVCLANVRRLSIAGNLYHSENNAFPPFRMKVVNPTDTVFYVNEYGRERPRWPWFFDQGIGPIMDPSPYVNIPGDTFTDDDTMMITNDHFICPAFKYEGFDRHDIRNGSYGYNYQYLGNSRVTGGRFQNFPVKSIFRPSETIFIGDSRGSGLPHGVHSYKLDPPRIALSKRAVAFSNRKVSPISAQHSPADTRHNGTASVAFVDGHALSMTLRELGYVVDEANIPIPDHPDGKNVLWSGTMGDEPDNN